MVEGMTRTADRPRARARPAAAAPRRVRIVGGRWKRTLLPVVDLPDLRPTPDRVRETLYNWLGQNLDGQRVLDLFAGTGALGFEAASRGAREVTLVENHPRASRHLEATRERLAAGQVRVVHGDADRWLDGALGVVAGLALARAGLPVDVVACADEEGHYGGCVGSRRASRLAPPVLFP